MKALLNRVPLPAQLWYCGLFVGVSLLQPAYGQGGARIWEEAVVIPTYKVAPPDPNPRFYSGRTYQGAKATFYPYPVSDQMTETREAQTYQAVWLENQYVKLSVMPELGGRIFTAVDKGNGYDFFYHQHVIKPALIGMLGAWISGGVEWNVPHHHRATSFMPVNHTMVEEPDGSKTVWIGETELRHRLRWLVGITLRPDHSYVEMTVKLFNRTPEAQSFLFWINPAVHANTNYQVIFPPSTQWAVQHGKPEFASWPIAHQVYGGADYSAGVDISWWKNHHSPLSFFAWDCQEDFFGGYDHGRQAGVVQISNHHLSPGKKFFEWGNGPEGEMWSKILTDDDGPYLELMAGSYSDNQPDYSWCQPGEVKVFKHYWYPIRELGGIKNANTEAAVDLEVSNRVARVAFNTTAAHPKARARLLAAERVLLEKEISINPKAPFAASVDLPGGITAEDLKMVLVGENGRELIAYQPKKQPELPKPKPVQRPAAPKDIATAEELYLTGLRIEQLYSPAFDPVPYYREALRRDPGDYRANGALGALYCRQARFAEAEPLLRAAVERSTQNYIRAKDGEAQYYLGVALRGEGKTMAAWEAFYRAVWNYAWQGAGYYALAELASVRGDYAAALDLVEHSLQSGSLNTKALELKAGLLRKSGRLSEAEQLAAQILAVDPLNCRALQEQVLIGSAKGKAAMKPLECQSRLMRGDVNQFLELAVDYANCGLLEEAIEVLQGFAKQAPDKARVSPLVYYYLASFCDRVGQAPEAEAARKLAATMPPDFCFPFQYEAESVLREAMQKNPRDSRAPYYLGNLLFDTQPEAAMLAWAKALELEPQFALAQRNLGLARAQAQKNVPAAIECLEKAVVLAPGDPRLYYELDVLYEAGGAPLRKRCQVLDGAAETVARRDDALTRRIVLLTADSRSAQALQVLRTHHFHNWEGSGSLHDVYVDACLRNGLEQLHAGEAGKALEKFQLALEYPANQEVGKPAGEHRAAEIYYSIGLALAASAQPAESEAAFRKAALASESNASAGGYYKARALEKVGKKPEALKIFQELEKHGATELERKAEDVDYFAKFGERRTERLRLAQAHYLAGLGCLGLERTDEAQAHFQQTLKLHPSHLGALSLAR